MKFTVAWRLWESYTALSIGGLSRRTSCRLSRQCRLIHQAWQSWATALSASSMSFAPLVSLLIPFGACCDVWQEFPSSTEAGSCTLLHIPRDRVRAYIYIYIIKAETGHKNATLLICKSNEMQNTAHLSQNIFLCLFCHLSARRPHRLVTEENMRQHTNK